MIDADDLVQGDRVHGSVYQSQQLFDREMEAIFSREWIYVGHEGEIPNKGDFRARQIGTQPVILLRDEAGVIRVLLNRCTHRANAVCILERGNAKAFTCAYHGWRFKLNGDLAVVPYSDRYGEGFDRAQLGLRPVPRVGSHRGFVFASLCPTGPSLAEHLGPHVMAELDDAADLSPEGMLDVQAGVHKAAYNGNWKLQIENSMDGYHPNFVHRSHFENIMTRTGSDPRPMATSSTPSRIRDLGNGHSSWDSSGLVNAGSRAKPSFAAKTDSALVYAELMIARHGRDRAQRLMDKGSVHLLVFPNLVLIGTHIRVIRPVAVNRTEVFLYPTLLVGAPADVNVRRLRAHENFYGPSGAGAPDDLDIFARIEDGLKARVDPWILLSRGTYLETMDHDGRTSGQMTDEIAQRGMWGRWKQLMGQELAGAGSGAGAWGDSN
jgi:phenylpropionate dioxygenase-like ring-hydroxylating dioxygenase large terminal subunit